MQHRKFPLSHRLSGVSERRMNVLRLQIGKRSKNVLLRHSFRNHADGVMTPGGVYHRRCGYPPSASACCIKKQHCCNFRARADRGTVAAR